LTWALPGMVRNPGSHLDQPAWEGVALTAEAVEKGIPPISSFLMFVCIDPPKKLHLTDYNL
jgi:hypothetical protein